MYIVKFEIIIRRYDNIVTPVRRLQALGRTAPEYTMKWRSQFVIANTHKSEPSPPPVPNHVLRSSTGNRSREARILILFAILLAYAAGCWVDRLDTPYPYTFLFAMRGKLPRTSLRLLIIYTVHTHSHIHTYTHTKYHTNEVRVSSKKNFFQLFSFLKNKI